MKIKKYNRKKYGYDKVELFNGIDGSGKGIFIIFSERTGSKGQKIRGREEFKTRKEADTWARWAF